MVITDIIKKQHQLLVYITFESLFKKDSKFSEHPVFSVE